MSCMIQDPKNTATLADWIGKLINCPYEFCGMSAPDSLVDALMDRDCYDGWTYVAPKKVYAAMVDLNNRAYAGRYREDMDAFGDPDPYEPEEIAKRVQWDFGLQNESGFFCRGHYVVESWHYRMHKLLSFFIYQCSEDATRNDELHLAMIDLLHVLENFIVTNSDAWGKYEWE